tara:strand:- start:877 stop:2010 length:1134 start_codon:yes stop_codon:yes gene_type:complete
MEDNNDFGMSLFGEGGMELNIDDVNPIDIAGLQDDPAAEPPAEPGTPAEPGAEPPADEIPNEDGSPEDVVGDEGNDDGSDDADPSPNLFSSFASELHKEGVLPSLDLDKNKIDNTQDLANVIKAQIDVQTKQYLIDKIGEDGYDAIEKGVSLAQYQQHAQTVQNLENITDEVITSDVDLATKIILEDYINQGLTEDRARKILQKTIDQGEEAVVEDAKESIKSLRVFEQNRLEQQKVANEATFKANQAKQEKIDNDLKNAIYNAKEIIPSIPLNKSIQDRVYQSITKVVSESPDGVMENQLMQDRRENPVDFDAKLYYLYELTNGFKDFSKIKTTATTQAVSDFEKALRQTKFESGGNPTFTEDTESYDGLGSEIVF